MRSMTWLGGRLVDLREHEAWDLMRWHNVGRIAWIGPEGLSVVPLNYVVADQMIWLRTAAYSTVAREARDQQVAFEVDEVDERTRSGWSVLVRGVARTIYGVEAPSPARPDVDVWPDGIRALQVAIEPTEIQGRRLLAA